MRLTKHAKLVVALILVMVFLILSGCSNDSSTSSAPEPKQQFVGSIKSNKYHYPSCEWAAKIYPENEIWFSTPEEAQSAGYIPCKVCDPPR